MSSTRWSLSSSLFSSLCCVGPAIAALIGVGSASVLVGLARYRLPMLLVGVGLSLLGAFLTLQRLRGTCTPSAYRRYRWQVPLTALTTFGVTYVTLTMGVPYLVERYLDQKARLQNPEVVQAESASAAYNRYQAVLAVSGMT